MTSQCRNVSDQSTLNVQANSLQQLWLPSKRDCPKPAWAYNEQTGPHTISIKLTLKFLFHSKHCISPPNAGLCPHILSHLYIRKRLILQRSCYNLCALPVWMVKHLNIFRIDWNLKIKNQYHSQIQKYSDSKFRVKKKNIDSDFELFKGINGSRLTRSTLYLN